MNETLLYAARWVASFLDHANLDTSCLPDDMGKALRTLRAECEKALRAQPSEPQGLVKEMREALEGVVRVADRNTVEFDRAREAIAKATPLTFANAGDSEAQFIADGESLNCPACGGSGHIGDTAPAGNAGGESELPGMWERADFTGGDPDERCHSERAAPVAQSREVDGERLELIAGYLDKWANDCEHSDDAETNRMGTFIEDCASGDLYDILTETAALLRKLAPSQEKAS